MVNVKEDLTSKSFGYLTVLYQTEDKVGKNGVHYPMWMCECKCGNKIVVNGNNLKNKHTQSCGCYNIEQSKSKLSKFNTFDLSKGYGVGYTSKNEEFYFDLEDYDKIKNYCWCINQESYVCTNIYVGNHRQTLFMHNLVLNNTDKNILPDHIHGKESRNDNRKSNLRLATFNQNKMNSQIQSNNTSGYTGVYWNKKSSKWQALIKINKKSIYLGLFDDKMEAVKARKEAETKYFGEFSYDYSQNM